MRFGSQRPPAPALRWVEDSLGGGARVVAWRAMAGGITSAVHRLTIDDGTGRTSVLVLRRYEPRADAAGRAQTAAAIREEAATLRAVHDAGLPAPEPVAADADGRDTGGQPAILMTRVPGSPDLTPASPQRWLAQMAAMAARIHELPATAPPLPARHAADPAIPASAVRPALWKAAFGILREQPPPAARGFLHGDYQHFNLLWRRGALTGVVDWAMAGTGPASIDTGHCRLNLAVLFGAAEAERFRLAYEAEAGRATDPWWDLYAVTVYGDAWRDFIPVQVAGRAPVDVAGMTGRVEELLKQIMRRA